MHIEFMENDEGMLFVFDPGRRRLYVDEEYPYVIGYDIHQQRGENHQYGRKYNALFNKSTLIWRHHSLGFGNKWRLVRNMNIKNGDLVSFNLTRDRDEE